MINKQKIVRNILLSFLFLALTGVVFCGVQWFSNSMQSLLIHGGGISPASLQTSIDSVEASTSGTAGNENLLPAGNLQVQNISPEVKSAISVEISQGPSKMLFNESEEKKLPVASLTKLMTAMVVLENYDLNARVIISDDAMMQVGEQGMLKLGETFLVKELLESALMESNNRAAYALAEALGVEKFIGLMNRDANTLGMENTHFQDVTGLSANSYSTAKDLSILTEYLFKNYPLFGEIISEKEYDLHMADGAFHHKAINTNVLLGQDNVVGGKTGFTTEAQGCFMILQENPEQGTYIISIILGAQDRFLEMKKLINWLSI